MIGLKFIPLRTPGGEITSHIGLFVKINIETLRHFVKGPKDLDSSTQPTPTKICYRSKSLENMVNYNALRHLVKGPKDLDSSTQPTPTKIYYHSKSLENMVNYNKDKGEQEITLHSVPDRFADRHLRHGRVF